MNYRSMTALALAWAACFPSLARAQTNDELLKELRALRDRVNQLEAKQKAIEVKGDSGQWGMTPAQSAELGRLSVKTEGLEDSREASGFLGLKISGQMQTAYIVNKAQDTAGFQFLDSVGDFGYNYFNSYIGIAFLDIQKEMEGGTKWRLTLQPQRSAGALIGGVNGQSVVQEASVSVPLTDLQTRFIAGQIPDWEGYEFMQPTQNKLITHNLLFDFTMPSAYVGAGLELARGSWTTKALLANMNQNTASPGDKAPVLAVRTDYYAGEFSGFGLAGVYGDAPNFVNPTANTRVGLIEADAYYARGDWTLQGQLSYGMQKQASITPDPVTGAYRTASWYGASALAGYKFNPRFQAIARVDFINNSRNGGGLLGYGADAKNGIGPDATLACTTAYVSGCDRGANRYALAVGLNYELNRYTAFKLEYRYDGANQPVFEDVSDGSYRKNNSVFGAAVVVGF